MLKHLIFVSTATTRVTPEMLKSIYKAGLMHNTRDGITGVLFYSGGHFLQFVEGEPQKLRALVERLRLDHRHRDLTVLMQSSNVERVFTTWSMGVFDVDNVKTLDIDALRALVSELLYAPCASMLYKRTVAVFEHFREQLESGVEAEMAA